MFANHKTTVNQNQKIYPLFKLLRKMFANHKTTVNQNLTLLTVMMAVACDFHSGRRNSMAAAEEADMTWAAILTEHFPLLATSK